MGPQHDLERGAVGVTLGLPEELERIDEGERSLTISDDQREVIWEIRHMPWLLDLNPEHDEQLRRDAERFTVGGPS